MMHKEKIGIVTEADKNKIQAIYERKNGLDELFLMLNSPALDAEEKEKLYEKLVADRGKTQNAYELWWENMKTKYGWKNDENKQWWIDFSTNEVYLLSAKECKCESC